MFGLKVTDPLPDNIMGLYSNGFGTKGDASMFSFEIMRGVLGLLSIIPYSGLMFLSVTWPRYVCVLTLMLKPNLFLVWSSRALLLLEADRLLLELSEVSL